MKEIQLKLDEEARKIKTSVTIDELNFMQRIGIVPIYRSFLTKSEIKMANRLFKIAAIEKGHDKKNRVTFYVESAIFKRLF